MPLLRTTRRRWTPPLAALLLALQSLGGGAVALAHAADREPPAAAFEVCHTAACPVLHDAARCALCQYAGLRVSPATPAAVPATTARTTRPCLAEWRPAAGAGRYFPAPPRAPPVLS